MKKCKRILTGLFTATMISTLMIGCGSSLKPEESAEILCEITVKQDITNATQLGISEDEAQTIVDETKSEQKSTLKINFEDGGLPITDEQLESIVEAYTKACTKIEYTVETTSSTSSSAQVKITSTYIDLTSIDTQAASDAIDELYTLDVTSEEESLSKAAELYVNNLVTGLNEASTSTNTVEKTFTFEKSDGYWLPSDIEGFAEQLQELMLR